MHVAQPVESRCLCVCFRNTKLRSRLLAGCVCPSRSLRRQAIAHLPACARNQSDHLFASHGLSPRRLQHTFPVVLARRSVSLGRCATVTRTSEPSAVSPCVRCPARCGHACLYVCLPHTVLRVPVTLMLKMRSSRRGSSPPLVGSSLPFFKQKGPP